MIHVRTLSASMVFEATGLGMITEGGRGPRGLSPQCVCGLGRRGVQDRVMKEDSPLGPLWFYGRTRRGWVLRRMERSLTRGAERWSQMKTRWV